jgi:hypothetical protein
MASDVNERTKSNLENTHFFPLSFLPLRCPLPALLKLNSTYFSLWIIPGVSEKGKKVKRRKELKVLIQITRYGMLQSNN